MRFKKAASLLAAAAVVTSAFSFSASAASYTYTMEDLASAPIVKTGTPGNIGENGALDPIWDKVEPVELRQKGQNDVTRPGLTGEVKTLWDQQKFYVLLKVTGDQKVVDGDTVYKTASWEDEVNVMLMQTWATVDEETEKLSEKSICGILSAAASPTCCSRPVGWLRAISNRVNWKPSIGSARMSMQRVKHCWTRVASMSKAAK